MPTRTGSPGRTTGAGWRTPRSDPQRALDIFREGLAYTRQHRIPYLEAVIASEAAVLEATHGDIDQALDLFAASIDSFHQSGATAAWQWCSPDLVVFFDRTGRPEIAATLYGTTINPRPATCSRFAGGGRSCPQHARHRHLRQLCPYRGGNDRHRSRPLRPPPHPTRPTTPTLTARRPSTTAQTVAPLAHEALHPVRLLEVDGHEIGNAGWKPEEALRRVPLNWTFWQPQRDSNPCRHLERVRRTGPSRVVR